MKKRTLKALGLFALVATLGLSVVTPARADWYGHGHYYYSGRYVSYNPWYRPWYRPYYGAGYYAPGYVAAPVAVAYAAPAPYYAPIIPFGVNVGLRIR